MNPTLLSSIVDRLAESDPARPFLQWRQVVWTAQDAQLGVLRLTHFLHALGVGPGDRIAVLSQNRPEVLLLLFAAARIGAILVPINTRYSAFEIATVLDDAQPSLLFCDTATLSLASSARSNCVPQLISLDEPTLQSQLRQGPIHTIQEVMASPRPTDPVLMLYTSGTTGSLRGALLSHSNLLTNVHQILTALQPAPGTSALLVTPLFHAAVVPAALTPLAGGLTLLIHDRFDPERALHALQHYPVSWTVLVPTMIQACIDALGTRTLPESQHQRTIYYGAAPAPRPLIIEARERLKAELAQSYGLTEATQCVTILTPEDHRRAITSAPGLLLSCGKPVAHTSVRILVNDVLEEIPHRVGEVVVSGPQVMVGYWQRPAETANVFFEGWLRTGDVGYLDADGYLYITDRLKDLVISGGENVYTPRVEDVIRAHPAVREVAVIGLPHPKWGETVHAVIALSPSYQPSEKLADDIVRHCRQFLGGFEIPRSIEFADQLPKTATGKILKRTLRSRQITDIRFALDLRDSIGTARLHSREGGTA